MPDLQTVTSSLGQFDLAPLVGIERDILHR
jgi:hypothetical protein